MNEQSTAPRQILFSARHWRGRLLLWGHRDRRRVGGGRVREAGRCRAVPSADIDRQFRVVALQPKAGEAGADLLMPHVVIGRVLLAAASLLCGTVAIAFIGDYSYFGQPVVSTAAHAVTWMTLVVAITSGLAGGLVSRVTLQCVSRLPWGIQTFRATRPALFAAACGIAVATVGAVSGGLTYGTGYHEEQQILESNAHLSRYYAPARALATLASCLSGVPAGLLAPSLSVCGGEVNG